MRYGYMLAAEEHPPQELVTNAVRAEQAGLDFLSISDHYHPWLSRQGEAAFVWTVLGAVAASTQRIEVGTGVTCPLIRVHPAVIAQAAATTAALFRGRFFFGIGTGENLNEHVTGERWPPADVRLAMLGEAVAVIRDLWSGHTVDHHGAHYTVENARLYTLPQQPPPIIMSGLGPRSAAAAGRLADGFWSTSPRRDLLEAYQEAGGEGPRYGQLNLCWAEDEEGARRIATRIWPNPGFPGQLPRDLPTPTHFEQLAEGVSEEQIVSATPCGPDPEPVLTQVRSYAEAGYDHVYFHQIGPDQEGFLRFWERELAPRLR